MKLVADEKDYEAWVAHREFVAGRGSFWSRSYRDSWLQNRWLVRIVVRAFTELFRERRRR